MEKGYWQPESGMPIMKSENIFLWFNFLHQLMHTQNHFFVVFYYRFFTLTRVSILGSSMIIYNKKNYKKVVLCVH
jgi:hypothetical protein